MEGWDVAHVGALGLRAAADKIVCGRRRTTTGFWSVPTPTSVRCWPPRTNLVRPWSWSAGWSGGGSRTLLGILIANLPQVQEELRLGSIVVIGDDSLRIRGLPIG